MLLGVSGDDVLPSMIYQEIRANALSNARGTVQADILKEDQAQNTCIFSTEFALKMMGDVQEHFIRNQVRNFYSVSISGYHIAEAGANPITQLAFTLSNGFTYVVPPTWATVLTQAPDPAVVMVDLAEAAGYGESAGRRVTTQTEACLGE
jgi:hypothetical protein